MNKSKNNKICIIDYDVGNLQSDIDIGKTSEEILKEFF